MEVNYDELYYLMLEKNPDAERILYHEVEKYLTWLCTQRGNYFLRREDILSYGWQGYIEALIAYDPKNTTSFKSFMQHCVTRRVIDVQRKHSKESLRAHMTGLLLSEESVMYIVDSQKKGTEITDVRLLVNEFWDKLNQRDKAIFQMYIMGCSREEIATHFSLAAGTIYRKIREIKERFKKELQVKEDGAKY